MSMHRFEYGRFVSFRKSVVLLALAIFAANPHALVLAQSAREAEVRKQIQAAAKQPSYVVLGYNDLGMHCMNQNFAEICILPPYNTLHAQVIRRGVEPELVTSGVTVKYSIPGNTFSVGKTNFWNYTKPLFGVQLAPNVGLTGSKLVGEMKPTVNKDWSAVGIPITPLDDSGNFNAYQLAKIEVLSSGKTAAATAAVVPVSWEIRCDYCHNTPGMSVESDILTRHDLLHKTNLMNSKPVLCAGCHADPALGTKGVAGVSSMSHAMHRAHATRMAPVAHLGNTCYACHPGHVTNCQRDIHFAKGIFCTNCHGDMNAVGNPTRTPWASEPSCGGCHQARKPKFQFEEMGKLYRDSRGHGGVQCSACHGSPHAVLPAVTDADNYQSVLQQGFAGTIKKCTVCHTTMPKEPFVHRRFD